MLDEIELRKPGFTEGSKVVLGDGQVWTLPKPGPVFYPTIGEGGIGVAVRLSYGRDLEPYFDEAFAGVAGELEAEIESKMRLAVLLLLANYDLADAEISELLSIRSAEFGSIQMWGELTRAIYEQGTMALALPDPIEQEEGAAA